MTPEDDRFVKPIGVWAAVMSAAWNSCTGQPEELLKIHTKTKGDGMP
jgi:hypothetical protein